MEQNVIKVQFFKPVDGKVEYFFSSLAAVCERFSVEQIGCSKQALWSKKITADTPYANSKCVITKHPVVRKPQSKKQ